jgi:hypothetical protein
VLRLVAIGEILLLLQFVTFSVVGIDIFSVDVLAAVLILIVGLDAFAFWFHAL